MEELLALDFTINPTFTPYEANRDLMRIRRYLDAERGW